MTAECLGETGMSLKDQIDHRHGKGYWGGGDKGETTHTKRNLTTGKCLSGSKV